MSVAPEVESFLRGLSAWQALIWIGAIVVIFVAVMKVWPAIKKIVATIETLETLPDDITLIKHELFPNSGKSLRDKVDRIDRHLVDTAARIARLEEERRNKSD